eukprot:1861441-Rhodomonas_salina.5
MLVWGTANPEGLPYEYNGFFFREHELLDAVSSMINIPVKIEHKGDNVGKVVSAWINNGKMDLLLDVDQRILEGSVISKLIKTGSCKDLSLGYTVQMSASKDGPNLISNKKITEVSLVRKGARDKCHIHGWTDSITKTKKN